MLTEFGMGQTMYLLCNGVLCRRARAPARALEARGAGLPAARMIPGVPAGRALDAVPAVRRQPVSAGRAGREVRQGLLHLAGSTGLSLTRPHSLQIPLKLSHRVVDLIFSR